MALTLRASLAMRSLFLNRSRAFTSQASSLLDSPITSTIILNGPTKINPITQRDIRLHNFTSIRLNTTQTDAVKVTAATTPKQLSSQNVKWEIIPTEVVSNPPAVAGAILPFAKLNFIQILLFPYTFSVMYYMDFLLNYMPWWMAIVGTTATARLVFFPVVLKLNKIGIKTYNLLPQTQKIQIKMNEAMLNGDAYNQALLKTKLHLLYKEHNLSLKDRLLPIVFQAPMYASIFLLLRGLTSAAAEGLETGGALWFTDLTVPDPYFILPSLTCTSMFLLFEFGLEGGVSPSTGMGPIGRYVLRGMPFVLFLFIHNFPAATLLFWSTSNLFTLTYALILKNSWVKRKLNIPARLKHNPEDLPLSNMSFRGQIKKAVDQGKVKRTSLDVRRLDDIAFRKAGVGPLRKTYKEPLKDV